MGSTGPEVSTRALTAPNVISVVRICLIPVFAWIFLSGEADLAAFCILAVLGGTDWVDGFVARRTGQISVLGKLLDPVADRVAIITVLLALAFRGTVWWPVAASILVRDAVVSLVFFVLESRRFPRLAVNFTGKVATSLIFLGMATAVASAAFPALWPGRLQDSANIILAAGAAIYWAAGALYLREIRRLKKRGAWGPFAAGAPALGPSAGTGEAPGKTSD